MLLIVPGINPVRAARLSSAASAVTLSSTVTEIVPRTAALVDAPDAFGKPFSELPRKDQAAALLIETPTTDLGISLP
jgi:hypothetical protein